MWELGDPSVYGEVDEATRTRAESIWGNSGDIWPPNMLTAAAAEEREYRPRTPRLLSEQEHGEHAPS